MKDLLLVFAGAIIGLGLGVLIWFGLFGLWMRIAVWRERNCATVTPADTDLGSGVIHTVCRGCLRLVGQKHKRSCELA